MNQIPTDSHMVVEEDEINVLDLLIVVAENIKLLILGPIVVGLLALGLGYALPQGFTSQAILALPTTQTPTQTPTQTQTQTPTPTQAAAMMVSPLVLDPVVKSLKLSAGRPVQVARAGLAKQIKAAVDGGGLLRLDVTANTPLQAQAIANAVIDTWLKSTVAGERDRVDLEQRLSYAKASLESVRGLLNSLAQKGSVNRNKALTWSEAGTSIIAVGQLQASYLAEVLDIPRRLEGLSRDVVMQPPTLPTEPVAPNKSLIAVLAALGSGFALLLWVFMLQAWKRATQDPMEAEKLARLRTALGFKAKKNRNDW